MLTANEILLEVHRDDARRMQRVFSEFGDVYVPLRRCVAMWYEQSTERWLPLPDDDSDLYEILKTFKP